MARKTSATIINIEQGKAISTKEARKILGSEFADLPDKQIDDLVTKLYLIAKGVILSESSI